MHTDSSITERVEEAAALANMGAQATQCGRWINDESPGAMQLHQILGNFI